MKKLLLKLADVLFLAVMRLTDIVGALLELVIQVGTVALVLYVIYRFANALVTFADSHKVVNLKAVGDLALIFGVAYLTKFVLNEESK